MFEVYLKNKINCFMIPLNVKKKIRVSTSLHNYTIAISKGF